MNRFKHSLRFALIEFAGILLLVLVPFLGPLPGPGGIPLILASLGLLSINHRWARRLREYIMKSSSDFAKKVFPAQWVVQIGYDVLTVLLVVSIVMMYVYGDHPITFISATALSTGTMLIFGMNRRRFDRFEAWFKRAFLHR